MTNRPRLAAARRMLAPHRPAALFAHRSGSRLFLNLEGIVGEHDASGRGIVADEVLAELARHPRVDEIETEIDSPGGALYDGLKINRALRAHRAKVTTIAGDRCASAATLILAAGRERLAYPHSEITLHAVSMDPGEPTRRWTAARYRVEAASLDKSDSLITDVYLRAGLRREFIERELRNETPLALIGAEVEGLIHGLVGGGSAWDTVDYGRPSSMRRRISS